MQQFIGDLRLAVRTLAKQPRFTIVAALTLALGIGAVTAIFSVVNAVLLQPLPYPNAQRLVNIWSSAPGLGYDQFVLSPDLFKFYKEQSTVFEDMALVQARRANLSLPSGPEVVDLAQTTAGYFPTLGANFTTGRFYTANEDLPTGPRVVVISHRLWQRAYSRSSGTIGQVARIDGRPAEIIGVAPAWMDRTGSPDLWMPQQFPPDEYPTGNFGWNAIARLKPGVTPQDAEKQLNPIVQRMLANLSDPSYRAFLTDGHYHPLVHFMKEDVVGDAVQPLWILLGTVGFVLLIACANVANLCLVRAEARQREVGVRLALGGSRASLIRTFMTEALVLAAVGAAAGVLVASAALPVLIRLAPATIPRLDEVRVDPIVIAAAAALAVVSALIFGLVPAVRYTREATLAILRHGGRSATDHPSRQRGRNLLVAVQTALAMILLIGSVLLARSFERMMKVDTGFDARSMLTVPITLPAQKYPQREDVVRSARQVVDEFAQLPGITNAGATTNLPIASGSSGTAFDIEGRPVEPGRLAPMIHYQSIVPGYFNTIRARITRGRDLDWHDTTNIVVNQAVADQLWPNQDPIGKRVRRVVGRTDPPATWYTVVGVIANIRQNGLRAPILVLFYFPIDSGFGDAPRGLTYVLRGPTAASQAEAIRRTVRAIDPDLPIGEMRTMEDVVSRSVIQFSFTMLTLAIASGVALILGAIGLYSVLSYAVSLQTREIGVRLALGAPRARVMRAIVARGAAICGVGLVVGLAGAFALTRLLRGLLFETPAFDPVTFAATAAALFLVALIAAYLPARRAAGISPMESMRAS